MDQKELITVFSRKIQKLPHRIVAAILFGSWAKGNAREDSDVDLLIVVENVHPERRKRIPDITRLKRTLALDLPLDILLMTRRECQDNFRSHNPLFLDIATEGVILFDPDGFLQNLISETRAYIRERNLVQLSDGWQFPVRYREATLLSQVTNRDFAQAMLCDGQRDLASGIILTKAGYFEKAVYHFQQATEKAIKSVLIALGAFKKSHFVSQDLRNIAKQSPIDQEWKEKLATMADIGEAIEPEVTLSRYPILSGGHLSIPYEEYTLDNAQKAQEQAETVLNIAEAFFNWWFHEPNKQSI